ncbi:MAG TPA: nuclear transport factor 2 family protein [Gemmatimonadales bacterium]|nr:nuclear transport factor 2 family protein [Gemmatimonadales bacterium]
MLRVALLLSFLAPAASASGSAQTRVDSMAAVREIHAALTDWVAAANRGDWKSASKVWAPDLIGWYPGQPDDTYAREMDRVANPKLGSPKTHYEVEVVEVMVSGRLAVVRDIWRFTTAAGNPDATTSVVRGFEVWTQQPDSSWRISRWITAPEPPAH